MPDRAILFLFGVAMVAGCVGAAVWIAATSQFGIDTLFLILVCLVAAFAFGLYVRYLIRGALAEAESAKPGSRESDSR